MKNIPSYIFGAIFLSIGIFLCYIALSELNKAKSSQKWHRTPGRILSSEIYKYRSSGKGSSSKLRHIPKMRYNYIINNKVYENTRISFYRIDGYQQAVETLEKFPIGKVVTVYFNPENNNESVLITGTSSESYKPLYMGIIMMLVSVAIVFFGEYSRKK